MVFAALLAAIACAGWMIRGSLPLAAIVAGIVLAPALAVGAAIDLHTRHIPDTVSLGLFPLGLMTIWWFDPASLGAHVAAGIVGGGILFTVAETYRAWRGASGLGLGDVKLFATAGAWVGPIGLPSVLLIACVSAISVLLLRRRPGRSIYARRIAFGPNLALALWFVWIFGPVTWDG